MKVALVQSVSGDSREVLKWQGAHAHPSARQCYLIRIQLNAMSSLLHPLLLSPLLAPFTAMRSCTMLALGVGFCLVMFVTEIASAPKFLVPPIISEGGADVRYLWTRVQMGVLHRTLPQPFQYNRMSWSRFLDEDAKGIAEGFYE